ncbi:MAG: Thiol:disulfide interchange protein DsbG [Luteibacter sp.]|uniref:thiol:disulfide interchange protein DsbG n=1 Tax=Luteibacter sp. TaxID=1886636 RepID=UPI00137FFA51|nr:thiol:disulfide interchange protein DsbG [Luteibacter sp.]KAF1004639.1 MAG: Thiol:disulfide interchange protein DsbG [Luteibacter sp.]
MIRVSRRALAATVLGALLSSHAFAADTKAPPPVLKALEAQGLTQITEFDAGKDMRGFAGLVDDHPMAIYVTADGNAIVGTRVDANGRRLDEQKVDDLTLKPMTTKVMKQLSEAKWVEEGKKDAPRVVYVFTDPNCPYCHAFWDAARPWVDGGKVRIRYLVVGVIREDSPNKAAAILTDKNPTEALIRNEKAFSKGGIAALKTIPADAQKTLDDNQMMMVSLGIQGTPGIVLQGPDGKLVKFGGMPRTGGLESILGPK